MIRKKSAITLPLRASAIRTPSVMASTVMAASRVLLVLLLVFQLAS